MGDEKWRGVVGYEGFYEVSSEGRVRSLDREVRSGLTSGDTRVIPGRVLKQQLDRAGYPQVTLRVGGRVRGALVHWLVAEAFLGERTGSLIRHLDDVRSNNTVANLSYGTPRDNQLDIIKNKNNAASNRTHCPRGHEYSPENTYRIPSSGGRVCKTCRPLYYRNWANKRKAASSG